jgi:hypothetical protein
LDDMSGVRDRKDTALDLALGTILSEAQDGSNNGELGGNHVYSPESVSPSGITDHLCILQQLPTKVLLPNHDTLSKPAGDWLYAPDRHAEIDRLHSVVTQMCMKGDRISG